jgi:hypothetical protein
MSSRRSRKSRALAMQGIELGFAVPQVIAHRLLRIAAAGSAPSVRDREEFYLMGAEKMVTFFESWNAMLLELFRANLELSLSSTRSFWLAWSGVTPSSRAASRHFQRIALGVLHQGVAPIHRRAVANAKRLRRVHQQ